MQDDKGRGWGFLVWLILLVLLLLVVLYLVVGRAKVRQVVVSGSTHYSNEQIVAMVGIDETTTILDVFRLSHGVASTLPYVQSVSVDYKSFDTIHIEVTEKTIVSYIPYQNQYLALDQLGYIVGFEKEKIIDLPSVEGLYFSNAVLGERLEIEQPVLTALLEFHHLGFKYEIMLEKLVFVKGDATWIEGYIGNVTINFGNSLNLDRKMKDASQVIGLLDRDVEGVLDLSVDTGSYIFRETIPSVAYIAIDEAYLAVDSEMKVLKKSRYPMKDQLMIGGLKVGQVVLGQTLDVPEEMLLTLKQLVAWIPTSNLTIQSASFENGLVLNTGDVALNMGNLDRFDEKIQAASALLSTYEGKPSGSIDLRERKDVYILEVNP